MRFLQVNDHGFSLVECDEENIPPYAILSHIRESDDREYTYQDIIDGKGKDKPGYQKVRFCVNRTAKDHLGFCWIDTCCINNFNRIERRHAIEPKLRWYQNAAKCYVYLSDIWRDPSHPRHFTSAESYLRKSRWFDEARYRPELCASASIEFFSREGTYLGNQISMARALGEITNISKGSLGEKTLPERSPVVQFERKKRGKPIRDESELDSMLRQTVKLAPLRLPRQVYPSLPLPLLNNGQRQAWMRSLRFGGMDVRQLTVANARPETCQWILYTSEYIRWLEANAENKNRWMLRIKGRPGTGKSTLMKFALRHAQGWAANGIITISFFFKSWGNYLEGSIAGAYRSLAVQLLERNQALQHIFSQLNMSRPNDERGNPWTIEALEILIRRTVRETGPILCFIDALDECQEDQVIDMMKFFEDIHTVAGSYGSKFQVCYSSRSFPQIPNNNGLELALETQPGHNQAIADYVENGLRIGSSKLADRIKKRLQEMSSGVFLWAVLVVDILQEEFDQMGIEFIQQRLPLIPATLDRLFRHLLSDRLGKHDEQLYFQLVLFARCPLSPEQLYSAICEPTITSLLGTEKTSIDVIEQFITRVSQRLTHVTKNGLREVQLIHESVRKFLVDHDGLELIGLGLKTNVLGHSHERLKHCCLQQIRMAFSIELRIPESRQEVSSLQVEDMVKEINSILPFLVYAASNLLFHANVAQLGGVPQDYFLETFPLIQWVRLHNLLEKSEVRRFSASVSLLYVLAACNMPDLIGVYPKPVTGLEIEDERYGCPVFAAMATGSKEALKAILKGNANDYSVEFNQCEIRRSFQYSKDRTVLSYAAAFGFRGIVSVLLENDDVDVNTADRSGQTALMFAAQEGHEGIVRLLLENDVVDVNIADRLGRTALMLAAERGYEAVVKMLLDTGRVNVTSHDRNGDGPLTLAASRGYKSVVQMLVDTYQVDAEVESLYMSEKIPPGIRTWISSPLAKRIADVKRSSREMETDTSMTFEPRIPDRTSNHAQAQPLTSLDETYLTTNEVVTVNPESGDLEFVDSCSSHDSDASSSTDSEHEICVSQVADDIFGTLFSESVNVSDVVRIHEALPEALRAYALEIGHMLDTQVNQDAMTFIRRNRRRIAELFLNTYSKRHRKGRNRVNDMMSVQEKISRWNEEKVETKYGKLEDELKSDELSLNVQADPNKFPTVDTTIAKSLDQVSKESKESNCMITKPSRSDFVTKTPAYELLLTQIRRDFLLVPSEPNHMGAIRQRILELFPAYNTVSEKSPAQTHSLRFLMGWDPFKFFEEQSYQGKPEEAVEKVITLTGSAQNAQAQTCAEYLSQTWPFTGKDVILFLKNILCNGHEHRHECELLNGTRLTAWFQGSQFFVEAFGTARSIADVGEQLAWLSAALRSSPFESGVAYCTPSFSNYHDSFAADEATECSLFTCTIEHTFEEGKELPEDVNGECWQGLFRNPLVVAGYPIPKRPHSNTGLEIPVSLMMALCQARTVTIFDGKPFIKGFCTMLVPTKHEKHIVTWHLLANEDGSHISYADHRVQKTLGDGSENIRIFDVERSRHIIGWCAYTKSYAGAVEADYDIGWSGLKIPYDGERLLRKTIGKKLIASSETFPLGLKDIPIRNLGDQYIKRLMWIAGKYVVLFDVEDGRAWMFDGASSLLHLLRASLRFSERDDFSDQFLFRSDDMEEAPATKTGKSAAIRVLTSEANKRIKLYEPTECLKDRVEDILHILEQIASYQDKAENSDIPPQQLEGFDFNAVAMVEERIKPRITELPPKGRGWVDFTKAIHAMYLFGSGFGELIKPTDNKTTCSFWDKVPIGENYLTVNVCDITRIQEREGNTKGGVSRLVDNIYWHKPEHIFEPCLCGSENTERHSNRIQMLVPRSNFETNKMIVQNPGVLAPNGAVIFSYDSQNLEKSNDARRSRSTSTHQGANITCHDSAIGSSLDSRVATPANSQFEAVSDTSTMSNKKRSFNTSMEGRSQDRSSSAVGEMENRFNHEKTPALTQADSCKKAKTEMPLSQQNRSTEIKMKSHRFTIGWISPLPLEKEAARLVMDVVYPQEEVQYDDVYYLGGRIGKHNVVIGVPKDMGLCNAAILAAKMSVGFPDIKYFLVVGIGGGVPQYGSAGALSEIVLGDVVVSYPRRKHGGVIQYDKGAWKDSGRLDFHGHTNGVHPNLMAAINNFRAKGDFLIVTEVLQQMRRKLDDRRKTQYDDPGATCDSLYADTYEHQGTRSEDCKDCCDREYLISRAKRGKAALRMRDTPFVHFGTIASSNQLQISVAERKRLQQEHEVLCFEMEAAGVMEGFPCMVIRGICDYADSHKNKGWQNYAAATAAAYAKCLLAEIPSRHCISSS